MIPERQHDRSAADELTDILRYADVDVVESQENSKCDDLTIEKGDRLVLVRQPYGSFAKTMLERQRYPDIRQYPGGPPKRPYGRDGAQLTAKNGRDVP